MKRSLRNTLCACAAVALAAASASSSAQSAHKLPEIKYQEFKLPNGLQVLTHEDHKLPLVAVDLWYHVGPLNEKPGRTGFAHLFEHMMFEGSEHVGEKAHIKYVQSAGATDVNGTTDYDRTNYFETVPRQPDRAGNVARKRPHGLSDGRPGPREARQPARRGSQRTPPGRGRPYDVADEAVAHLLFPKGHPYYGSVIGSHAMSSRHALPMCAIFTSSSTRRTTRQS